MTVIPFKDRCTQSLERSFRWSERKDCAWQMGSTQCHLQPWFPSLCADRIAQGVPLLSEGAAVTGNWWLGGLWQLSEGTQCLFLAEHAAICTFASSKQRNNSSPQPLCSDIYHSSWHPALKNLSLGFFSLAKSALFREMTLYCLSNIPWV